MKDSRALNNKASHTQTIMPKLSTHVLDTSIGRPAAGMHITLWRTEPGDEEHTTLVKRVVTNSDGRIDNPLLADTEFVAGDYELEFDVRDYFTQRGVDCPFLNIVPICFTVSDATKNYHVPLLVTPWAYSTYRGS